MSDESLRDPPAPLTSAPLTRSDGAKGALLPLPPKPVSEPPSGSWLSILLALGGASIIGAVLSLVTLFYLLPVFVIAAIVFLVAAFHYFVWGWWMKGFLAQIEDTPEISAEVAKVAKVGRRAFSIWDSIPNESGDGGDSSDD